MRKRFLYVLLIICMILSFTACYSGIGKADMKITSADGAGTRTFSVELLKDGAANPDDGKPIAEMFTQDGYFPKGINAVVDMLNSKRPAGVPEIAMEEKSDRYVLSYTITFTSIDDFNAKVKAIAGKYWDANKTEPSAITAKKVDGGTELTYTEDIQLSYTCDLWASNAMFDDTTGAYNVALAKSKGVTPEGNTCIFFISKVSIDIGGTVTEFDKNATEISAKGVVPASPGTSETSAAPSETTAAAPADASNPKTGDNNSMIWVFALTAIISTGAFIVLRKKTAER